MTTFWEDLNAETGCSDCAVEVGEHCVTVRGVQHETAHQERIRAAVDHVVGNLVSVSARPDGTKIMRRGGKLINEKGELT